ncbi:hypothetical protein MUK42_11946, partial [Musa troglodytarum]
ILRLCAYCDPLVYLLRSTREALVGSLIRVEILVPHRQISADGSKRRNSASRGNDNPQGSSCKLDSFHLDRPWLEAPLLSLEPRLRRPSEEDCAGGHHFFLPRRLTPHASLPLAASLPYLFLIRVSPEQEWVR